MYNVVFECSFIESAFCEDMIYNSGEVCYFTLILTADCFLMAYERAIDYAVDHYASADVKIVAIVKI